MKYVCPCGYVYDPEVGDPDNGIAPGTPLGGGPRRLDLPRLRPRQGFLHRGVSNIRSEEKAPSGVFFSCCAFRQMIVE